MSCVAPVISHTIDPESEGGAFAEYVQFLSTRPFTDLITQESGNLSSYFSALSGYLTYAQQTCGLQIDPALPGHDVSAQNLRMAFEKMALRTGNLFLSDIALMPSGTMKVLSIAEQREKLLQGKMQEEYKRDYSKTIKIGSYYMDFGFYKIDRQDEQCTVIIPVLKLDRTPVDLLPESCNTPILESIQRIHTTVNHDMLHHYTSDIVRENIASSLRISNEALRGSPLSKFYNHQEENLRHDLFDEKEKIFHRLNNNYEQWAITAHAEVMMHNTDIIQNLKDSVNHCFDLLENAKCEMTQCAPDQMY